MKYGRIPTQTYGRNRQGPRSSEAPHKLFPLKDGDPREVFIAFEKFLIMVLKYVNDTLSTGR
jgi:hypothetical protein